MEIYYENNESKEDHNLLCSIGINVIMIERKTKAKQHHDHNSNYNLAVIRWHTNKTLKLTQHPNLLSSTVVWAGR